MGLREGERKKRGKGTKKERARRLFYSDMEVNPKY
jgi:hypothetical protein